ncbi:MAG: hypothetical protein QW735_00935 [archaeon]
MLIKSKAQVYFLEAFIATVLLFSGISSIYFYVSAKYRDFENSKKMYEIASDFAFSLCNNGDFRENLSNESYTIPEINFSDEIGYRIEIYNDSGNYGLRNLVSSFGQEPTSKTVITLSCIIVGSSRLKNAICDYEGSNCSEELYYSDDIRVNVSSGENITITFSSVQNPDKILLILEGNQNSGVTNVYNSSGELIASYSFSQIDESVSFDLTGKVTDNWLRISPTGDASYDYAKIEIGKYNPKKIVVKTWWKK